MNTETNLRPLPAAYLETTAALHRLAVYVISPAQRLANGEIIMRASPGGFSTFEFDGRIVRVDGVDLVVEGRDSLRMPISSLGAAALALGIEPDVGQQEQFDVPPAGELDAPLTIDPNAVASLGEWFAFVTDALEVIRAESRPQDDVSIVRIWPEHFDAAIDHGDQAAKRRGTFGGSPGDRHHAEPYLYVSPWAGRIDAFFGDPSFRGASLTHTQLVEAQGAGSDPAAVAVAFLREARDLIARHQ